MGLVVPALNLAAHSARPVPVYDLPRKQDACLATCRAVHGKPLAAQAYGHGLKRQLSVLALSAYALWQVGPAYQRPCPAALLLLLRCAAGCQADQAWVIYCLHCCGPQSLVVCLCIAAWVMMDEADSVLEELTGSSKAVQHLTDRSVLAWLQSNLAGV